MASFAEPLGIVIHHSFGFWTGWMEPTDQELDGATKPKDTKREKT
jgi:hypothetical protein